MNTEPAKQKLPEDFLLTAIAVLISASFYVLLSTATHLAAKTPWPQMIFLDVFRRPALAMLAVILTPTPLFSPLVVALLTGFLPLFFHIFFLKQLWNLIRDWNLRSRILYIFIATVPIFGPIACQTLLQSLGELK